jgi:FkbM family methyltransferase
VFNILERQLASIRETIKMASFKRSLPRSYRKILNELSSFDTVIDVGANVGLVSKTLSKRGARVIAFEPNKIAFDKLKRLQGKFPNLTCINKAVGINPGLAKLYLHNHNDEDPLAFSTGSSLLQNKPNVSNSSYEVEVVDFALFLSSFKAIKMIKIDIEGYEVELIPHLINNLNLNHIEYIFVETHEKKWPEISSKTEKMKNLVKESNYSSRFYWDWP